MLRPWLTLPITPGCRRRSRASSRSCVSKDEGKGGLRHGDCFTVSIRSRLHRLGHYRCRVTRGRDGDGDVLPLSRRSSSDSRFGERLSLDPFHEPWWNVVRHDERAQHAIVVARVFRGSPCAFERAVGLPRFRNARGRSIGRPGQPLPSITDLPRAGQEARLRVVGHLFEVRAATDQGSVISRERRGIAMAGGIDVAPDAAG